MTVPNSFLDHFANKVVIKNVKLSSWAYNIQKFWFMLRSLSERFVSILHCRRKYLELDFVPSMATLEIFFFFFFDQGVNLKFRAVFTNRSLLKVNKNVKIVYEDNLSLIKSAFEIGSSADKVFHPSVTEIRLCDWKSFHRQRFWKKTLPKSLKTVFVSRNLVVWKLSRWSETSRYCESTMI